MALFGSKEKFNIEEVHKGEYKITAKIVDAEEGLKVYNNLHMIRISSIDHTLLIMEDYMPVVGRVTRSVELVTADETITIGPIQGFYMHKKNEFFLLIDSHEPEKRPNIQEEEQNE